MSLTLAAARPYGWGSVTSTQWVSVGGTCTTTPARSITDSSRTISPRFSRARCASSLPLPETGIFGLSSGRVVEKIGRTPSIFLAGSLQCIGFLVSSLLIEAGMVPFTLGICLFYAGQGLMFSPITTMVLGTLSASQAGRGIGTNDLVMNVSGSIDITIFGSIMGTTALSGLSLIGAAGKTATYSNLLLIYAAAMMLGIIAFACFRKAINPKER